MKISTYKKSILTYILILVIITLPYFIWGDRVKFAPDILLNEWYKTLFISGIIGLFYKFYVEKKISEFKNSNMKRKELDIISSKLNFVINTFIENPETAKQNIAATIMIVETSFSKYTNINTGLNEILDNINLYSSSVKNEKKTKEMENQIKFKTRKIIRIVNNLK